MIRLTLPLPPRELSPNVRSHWATKSKAVKAYRTAVWALASVALGRKKPRYDRAEIRTTWYLPDARRRDGDNLSASMKAGWDGLVDAGLFSDDRYLVHHPPALAVDRERPRIEVVVTPIDEQTPKGAS